MTDHPSLDTMIDRLDLEPHPEGGYFRETWRSDLELPGDALPDHDGPRDAGTSILFLLPEDESSARHRIVSDELWLYQYGDPVELTLRHDDKDTAILGPGPDQQFQHLVPGGRWQSATSIGDNVGYSLVACLAVPGFEFDDFELVSGDNG